MDTNEQVVDASKLSHDLKTPLTGVSMMLQLLAEEKVGSLNERQRFMVDEAKKDCTRLEEVIRKHIDSIIGEEQLE
jgi:signal transduction histidine kinase